MWSCQPGILLGVRTADYMSSSTTNLQQAIANIVRQAQAELEKELISRALDETGGNVTRAAKLLRMNYKAFLYRMEKFGLRILEGYGITECSPVVAVNPMDAPVPGTIGKLMPSVPKRYWTLN